MSEGNLERIREQATNLEVAVNVLLGVLDDDGISEEAVLAARRNLNTKTVLWLNEGRRDLDALLERAEQMEEAQKAMLKTTAWCGDGGADRMVFSVDKEAWYAWLGSSTDSFAREDT